MLQDFRYAVRTLARSRGLAAVTILTLGLGIGASTAIFSVVDAVLLKPLPYPTPDRLVTLVSTVTQGTIPLESSRRFNAWRLQTQTFEDVTAYTMKVSNLTGQDADQILSFWTNESFFHVFGARMAHGRPFTVDEDRPGGRSVAILTFGFWQRRFGGRRDILGEPITIDDVPYTIVGVLDREFRMSTIPLVATWLPDVVVPLRIDPAGADNVHYLAGAARLRKGVAFDEARLRARAATASFRQQFPDEIAADETFDIQRLESAVVGDLRASLLIFAAAVGMVLLIACANVASLLLVHASGRTRELSIRAALGASRARVARQLFTETATLALAGATLGIGVALAGVHGLLALTPQYLPWINAAGWSAVLDWRVLAFVVMLTIAVTTLIGTLPSLQAGRASLPRIIAPAVSAPSSNRTRTLIVVSETALAVMLLVGAALLVQSFVALRAVDPGFQTARTLSVPMALNLPRFQATAATTQLVRDGLERLRGVTGVEAAAAGCCAPMLGRYGMPFTIPGRVSTGADLAGWVNVSPGYFRVFGIPVVRGRDFTEVDSAGSPGVVIINETMARQQWPNGNALDERLVIGRGLVAVDEPPLQIIGIVGDVLDTGLNGATVPMMYVPVAQVPDALTALHARSPLTWFVRTQGNPFTLRDRIEAALLEASGGIPIGRASIRSMDDQITETTNAASFRAVLVTLFASSALALAVIGIYGVMSYLVQQRTRDIGIRLALGAQRSTILTRVISESMAMTASGVALGLVGAALLTRYLRGLLFNVSPLDPLAFGLMATVFSAAAALAAYGPARRATEVDPMIALRNE
jgi:predicted permease